MTWDRFLPRFVGGLEQFMYTSAVLIDAREFIAVWLALKLAGEWAWRRTDRSRSYPMFNIFLIGNGLSVSLGAATALIIRRWLPPFP